ncbi:class I SAM-dependent methyltransferase [Streptomyces sp. NPDC091204]|uniref:class I SAM-dependent methyltransferase n=1 Tax=Streptomyces sp. NPDC091204 TaxID=3155299 RepID=UPI0034166464
MSRRTREGYQGTGPGAITPDGCAVELYERLPVGDEPEIIGRAVPAEARILELGSGVGRVTHPLVERGFTVTAVDESPQMLERVHGARTVCSPIEELELDERFDVVLLGSFLVHAGDPRVRRGLLRTCRRHVADDGCVLIQREGEGRHENLPHERKIAGGLVRVLSSDPVSPGVRSVHVEYVFPDVRWTQTFLSRPLTTEAFELALREAGLAVDAYLTGDRTWARARPVTGRP